MKGNRNGSMSIQGSAGLDSRQRGKEKTAIARSRNIRLSRAMAESDNIVKDDCVVQMHYVLKDRDGTVIDESPDGEPLPYLHGHENIVPGLEKALTGVSVGTTKKVVVSPEEGYGAHEADLVLEVPLEHLPSDMVPEVGMTLEMETDQGLSMPVRVAEVHSNHVKLDANHELAGVELHFEVTIASVRAASAEELAHGHVHGPGGHHHH